MLGAFLIAFFIAPANNVLNATFYAIVLPVALWGLRREDYRSLVQNPVLPWMLPVLVYLALSAVWATEPSGDRIEPAFHAVCVFYFVALVHAVARTHPGWMDRLLPVSAAVVALHASLVTVAWYVAHPLGERVEGLGRLDHPLQLATVYAALAAACAVGYLQTSGRRAALYLAALGLASLGIVLTQSRGPLIALLLVAAAVAAVARTRKGIGLLMLLGSGAVVAIGLYAFAPDALALLTGRGDSFRFDIWTHASQAITPAWLFGHGLGAEIPLSVDGFAIAHGHNLLLSTALYGGLVGVLALLAMIARVLQIGLRAPAAAPWYAALCSALICQVTNGDTLIVHPHPVWLYFWLPFTLIAVHAERLTADRSRRSP